MAVVRGRSGNPRVLIGEQSHIVEHHAVGHRIQCEGLRASLLLVTIGVLECDVLKESIGTLHHDGSTRIYAIGIVATAETAVQHDSLVAVLTNDVQVRLLCRNVDVLLILSVLHEDEPRRAASFGSSVDGCLQRLVVARTVGSHHGIVEAGLGLLALHGGKGNLGLRNGIAATADEHALRHGEGVLGGILQTAVLEDGALTADDGSNLLAVERSSARAGLHLVIEGQDDGAIGTHACCIILRIAAHKGGLFIGSTHGIGQYEDFSDGGAVVVTLHTNLLAGAVGHPANPYALLIVGLCGQGKLLGTVPATGGRVERAYLGEVGAVNGVFHVVHTVRIVVVAETRRDDQVLIALRREGDFKIPLLREEFPDAGSILAVLLTVIDATGQPSVGSAVGLPQRQHAGIL